VTIERLVQVSRRRRPPEVILTIQSVQRAGIAIGGRCPAGGGFGAGRYGGHEPHEVVKAVVTAAWIPNLVWPWTSPSSSEPGTTGGRSKSRP